ncbi:MAG TPA: glycogen debranching protein GlgX [Gemmatimonadales bacterium]|nr:glycogen debranching protein GlgX [Gemmatimonadales bacterium]
MDTAALAARTPPAPEPGAHLDADGTRFVVASSRAERVELCLFSDDGTQERRVPMDPDGAGLWHCHVGGAGPGQLYGFRAHGPWIPHEGHRFNAAKLLLDPYARAVSGPIPWHPSLCDHRPGEPDVADSADSAPHIPKSVVVPPDFDWRGDAAPRTPIQDSLIYECHVRGMTMQHPEVPPRLRGTFLGLASEPVLQHLRTLGVTAVELLPIMHAADDARLARLGLTNYWGYSTAAFFAPDARFSTSARGAQVAEFQEMVRRLHATGIEVILDVVYNHSAEIDVDGPTLSFRGLDNAAWYLPEAEGSSRYLDVTGCGNTLDVVNTPGRSLLFDSLRYWVAEMHVDGFRFDLAPALARGGVFPDTLPTLFQAIAEDPVLAHARLIAEPWDVGRHGYQLGRFPAGWSEWNDRYRDTVRRFWRGATSEVSGLATALAGSSDLFGSDGRGPHASVNFVSCHDGFTLADLVRYERRHNEANGEENRDGHATNWSRNWGVEGETNDPAIQAMRDRAARAMIATVLVSQGLPMIGHGDELLRSQRGNNNAYCHDGPLTWINWDLGEREQEMLDFVRGAAALRRRHPVLRRLAFLAPPSSEAGTVAIWFRPDGAALDEHDWRASGLHAFGLQLRENGSDLLLLLLNGGAAPVRFTLPPGPWALALASAGNGTALDQEQCRVPAYGLAVLDRR